MGRLYDVFFLASVSVILKFVIVKAIIHILLFTDPADFIGTGFCLGADDKFNLDCIKPRRFFNGRDFLYIFAGIYIFSVKTAAESQGNIP